MGNLTNKSISTCEGEGDTEGDTNVQLMKTLIVLITFSPYLTIPSALIFTSLLPPGIGTHSCIVIDRETSRSILFL